MRRATTKKARPGELRIFHGRLPGDSNPDVILSYGGAGATKRDSSLLHWVLCSERAVPNYGDGPRVKFEPSLIEELKSRGYDITTLEFRIRKLPIDGEESA